MRQCHLEASLVDVWHLSQHITNNGPAPVQPGMRPYSLKQHLFPWDLPTIAREVVLNADRKGRKRLNSSISMQTVINTIRRIENAISKEPLVAEDVMKELHRSIHRQFPWQQKNDLVGLLRYLKVFGSPEVGPILERTTGFGIRDYFGFVAIVESGRRICISSPLIKQRGCRTAVLRTGLRLRGSSSAPS